MYNENQAVSARFSPASAPLVQRTGESQPALNEINERVSKLRGVAAALASRLRGTADRALGDTPSASGSTNGSPKPPSIGQASAIFDGLSDLAAILDSAHTEANRLERVA